MNTTSWREDRGVFYRRVFALVIPMALQNLINVGVNAADVIMLGKVGETVLSASSLAGQIFFILILILFGVTSGASVLTSQYWGKRDMKSISHVFAIALRFAILISVLFTIAAVAFPSTLMRIYTKESDVIAQGAVYLRIIAFSYVFEAIVTTYLSILRSVERVIISTVVYSISLVVNVILNAIFIFGLLGFPVMGIKGAAIATLIARIVEFVIILIYAKKNSHVLPFRLHGLLEKNKLLFQDFIRYSTPVIINEMLWGVAISFTAAVIGHLGKSVVAANSVAQVTRQLATVLTFGIAHATAIVVGKAIGEDNVEKAKIYAKRFAWLSILFGLFGSVVVLIARPIALHTLALTPNAQGYLSFMMYVIAYYVVCQSFNATMIVGNFRAGGDTKIGLVFDVASMWCFSLPIGFLAAFVFHFPIPVIYFILTMDELVKVIPSTLHFKNYKWLHNVTR